MANKTDWAEGRYAALNGKRRRWFASAAWKRGWYHGKNELLALRRMKGKS